MLRVPNGTRRAAISAGRSDCSLRPIWTISRALRRGRREGSEYSLGLFLDEVPIAVFRVFVARSALAKIVVIPAHERLGLNRVESAEFIGVSPTKFDDMVADGRMPKPKMIDSRRVWSREALVKAFAALPDTDGEGSANPWADCA